VACHRGYAAKAPCLEGPRRGETEGTGRGPHARLQADPAGAHGQPGDWSEGESEPMEGRTRVSTREQGYPIKSLRVGGG